MSLTPEQREELRRKLAVHLPAEMLDEVHAAAVASIEAGKAFHLHLDGGGPEQETR